MLQLLKNHSRRPLKSFLDSKTFIIHFLLTLKYVLDLTKKIPKHLLNTTWKILISILISLIQCTLHVWKENLIPLEWNFQLKHLYSPEISDAINSLPPPKTPGHDLITSHILNFLASKTFFVSHIIYKCYLGNLSIVKMTPKPPKS